MPPSEAIPRHVRLPRNRLRSIATRLQSLHRPPPSGPLPTEPIDVVCISDTHGTQPPIPQGDILLHAGDLTQWGTFSEIQAQLTWLSNQPHKYKVIIAGNHDLLLDANFRIEHSKRWEQAMNACRGPESKEMDASKTSEDLNWGGLIYLQDTSTTLTFGNFDDGERERTITIYGSPSTPQHALSAFQYPKDLDVWTSTIPPNTDILLTHGPPWGHLDGAKKSGCAFLAREVAQVRPRMVVFGHVHVGYGTEEVLYDTVGQIQEGIRGGWVGWPSLAKMLAAVVWGRALPRRWRERVRKTTFVNAAVVEGWEQYKVKNEAVVVRI